MRCGRRWSGTVILIALVSACSANGVPTVGPDTSIQALVGTLSSHCTDLNSPELGEGSLCIDNGFRLKTDDFAFENWGRSPRADENVTVQTLVDMFGRSSVCTPGDSTQCIMRPAAIQTLDEWNTALAGGRCEGMATMSARFFLRYDDPADFRTEATRVSDLRVEDPVLNQSIVYWWATQFVQEVTDRAAESRNRSPLELVDDLVQGLAHGSGYTLGLYDAGSGHSVTPFAVTRRGNNFIIHVYDNNFPGVRREVSVGMSGDTWRYPAAQIGIDGTAVDWSGSTGTLELTPMASRQGPFSCSFCNQSSTDATVITLATHSIMDGFINIATRDGQSIEVSQTSVDNSIPGATYRVGKGSSGGLVTVTIPAATQEFDVGVRRARQDVPAGDIVVSVRRPGMASIQVSGNLAHGALDAASRSVLIAVRTDRTTVNAPATSLARVSLAAGGILSRAALDPGEALTVNRIANDSIDLAWKGGRDSASATKKIDTRSDSEARELTLTLDDAGEVAIIDKAISPVTIEIHQPAKFTPTKRRPARTTTTRPSTDSITISRPD